MRKIFYHTRTSFKVLKTNSSKHRRVNHWKADFLQVKAFAITFNLHSRENNLLSFFRRHKTNRQFSLHTGQLNEVDGGYKRRARRCQNITFYATATACSIDNRDGLSLLMEFFQCNHRFRQSFKSIGYIWNKSYHSILDYGLRN